jgi:hypothetical protein
VEDSGQIVAYDIFLFGVRLDQLKAADVFYRQVANLSQHP